MLTIREKGLLLNIIKHCHRTQIKTKHLTRKEFDSNEDIFEVICFNILHVGELAKHFDQNFLDKHSSIPWKQIKGMRDIVAHGYGTINHNEVWSVVTNDIDTLCDYCEKLINDEVSD